MRVILAGLFVFTGLLLGFLAADRFLPKNFPPQMMGIVMAVWMLILIVGTLIIFNFRRPTSRGKSAAEQLQELEAKGLLIKTDYHARRAFVVEEFEDEGQHLFIELNDGGILYLNDQCLCEYERFPCTEFTISRHREEGWVADIQCRGTVLQPEELGLSFSKSHFEAGLVPDDGEIWRHRSFEQLKADILKTAT